MSSGRPESTPETVVRQRDELVGLCFGLMAALLWGLSPVISRYGVLHSLNAYDITAIRFFVSGLILLPVLFRSKLAGIGWGGAAMIAAGAGLPYVIITNLGLTFSTASHGGVIIPGSNIILATIGLYFLANVTPGKGRLVGIFLILTGMVLVGLDRIAHLDRDALLGDFLFVLGGGTYALFTIFSQKYKISAMHAVAIVSVFSLFAYAPFYLLFAGKNILNASVSEILIQAVAQGVLISIFATWSFARAITTLGGGRAVVFVALMPVFSVLLAVPLLGEWPAVSEFVGLSVIFAGTITALNVVGKLPGPSAVAHLISSAPVLFSLRVSKGRLRSRSEK